MDRRQRRFLFVLVAALGILWLLPSAASAQGMLEHPQNGSVQSGINGIWGWVCEAGQVEVEIDNTTTFPAAYGFGREDTRAVCGDADNGVHLPINWNLLGNGQHTVRLLADGQEVARSTFSVVTLGQEFVTGTTGQCTLEEFPGEGKNVTLVWDESLQNFVIGGTNAAPPPAFELDTTLELGRLSLQAYQMLIDAESGQTFTLPAPYQLQVQILTAESFTNDDPLPQEVPIAFVATAGDAIYVVFRGTETVEEWILDAEFDQVPYTAVAGGGQTEQGFTRVYSSINTVIIEKVRQLASSGAYAKLYVTGHSLGGALAVLAVPELAAKTTFTKPTLYTFAGPFVGNSTFVTLYTDSVGTSWRVVNTNDIVPKLPPPLTVTTRGIFFYEAVPAQFTITFGQPIDIFDPERLINNHSMCNYYNTLCALTPDPQNCMTQAGGADGCNVQ